MRSYSEIREDIIGLLFTDKGQMNKWALRDSWIEKNNVRWLIDEIDSLFDDIYSVYDKIMILVHYDGIEPLCKICGSRTRYHRSYKKFAEYCSRTCESLCPNIKEKHRKAINTDLLKQGMIEKYGTSQPMDISCIKEKRDATNLERYGDVNPSRSDRVKKKISDRLKGSTHQIGTHGLIVTNIEAHKRLKDRSWLEQEMMTKPQSQIAVELGVSHSLVNQKAKSYGIDSVLFYSSTPEKELVDFIENNSSYQTITRTRKIGGVELDIFIPEKNFAIEFNGMYWHSTDKLEEVNFFSKKHVTKTNIAEKHGVHLFHIFENEWGDVNKKEIWKSMILNKIGKSKRIFARQCSIVEDVDYSQFFIDNHIQGKATGNRSIALVKDGVIVSLALLGKNRFRKNGQELIRFCSLKNHCVVGGFSKIMSKINTPLISYGNRRWAHINGNMYQKNEFLFERVSMPNYFYLKNHKIYSRMRFQKHKLKSLLENFDVDLSEKANMLNNGYRVIYDCGNVVYSRK